MTKDTATFGAITAGAPSTEHGVGRGVLAAPADWYARPEADQFTRLTVTDDGQVYGHIAPWGAAHRATGVSSEKVRGDDFTEFHTGRVTTAEGDTLDIGHLTIGGGHAPLDVPPQAAVEHYDNVATAWAHVRAVEGRHGIWVSGSVAPGVTDLMLHKAKAFPPSGDWRQFTRGGRYQLVACCQVVTPGFPVHEMRAQIASAAPGALVASTADWAGVTAAGDLPALGGPAFRILVFPEGNVSRDGRQIDVGATSWGEGPWTLWHKLRDEHGSMETEGTVMVGRIDRFERNSADEVWGFGNFDTSDEAMCAAQLVDKQMLRGISADLGEMRGTYLGGEVEVWVEPEDSDGDPSTPETITIPDEPFDTAEPWMTVQYAELLGATLCGKPSYREGQIFLEEPVAALDDAPDATVTPIAASMVAAATGRQRIAPFTVVGRPRQAQPAPIEQQLADLRQLVVQQGRQIEALTSTFAPGVRAHLTRIAEQRREKALARIDRVRRS